MIVSARSVFQRLSRLLRSELLASNEIRDKAYSSLGGGTVVQFPRIWMLSGECRVTVSLVANLREVLAHDFGAEAGQMVRPMTVWSA